MAVVGELFPKGSEIVSREDAEARRESERPF